MSTSAGDQGTQHPGGATTSIWQGTARVPAYPPLHESVTADVCVVGAGIAGLSVAYHLAREGKHVVVLDDGPVGGGETGRTTAHLTNAMDDRIHWLESVHGAEGARLVVESHGAAMNRIQQIVQLEDIACDFLRLDGYLMSRRPGESDELLREAAAASRAGLTDVSLVERAPIAAFESGTALRFPGQAQLHPLRYVAGLAEAIVDKYGGQIFCDTYVEEVEGGDPCTVRIAGGVEVTADAVVVCTNASISDMVRTHMQMEADRTYAIAARVPRGSVERALYWDTGMPYHYARLEPLSPSGEDATPTKGDVLWDALIVGGEDHRTGHGGDAEERWERIDTWMRQRWPQAGEVVYRWSGQVLEPADGLAYIGRNPDGAANVYMASGDSGQGMTHGTIAGMLIADLVLGRENAWAALYDPHRVSLKPSPAAEVVKHNTEVMVDYALGYLKPGEVAGTEEIPPGEGRVLRRGLKKVAVYRDAEGTLHERSAVCTHMKCIVEWNGAEKTWDCPCHGSRFDPYGAVLNGPAIEALGEGATGHHEPPRRTRKSRV